VPICEAYLAFLASNGDMGAYWRVLSDAGVSRARLESFDRPIVTDPVFFADKRDNLIRDFNHYLGILKATHSGADLQASAAAAAPHVPASARGYLGYVLGHVADAAVLPLMEAAVEARTELAPALGSNRELLYLDLALEAVVRGAAERGAAASGTAAAALLGPLLQNVALSVADNEELCYCLKAWQELPEGVRAGRRPARDDALKAMAVLDRVRRALAGVADRASDAIGPVSQSLGDAFGCEPWAVQLFAEEVVRSGPAFGVSLALSAVEPAMRAAAELGAWQVISPGAAAGRLCVVPSLHGIQDKVYEEATVLLARQVTGEEEVPAGVVALLSGDCPDVLSHLSVRARNMRVLFAACHDPAGLDALAALEGARVELRTTAAGAVTYAEAADAPGAGGGAGAEGGGVRRKALQLSSPTWRGQWAVGMDAFADGVVGAKSKNLAGLRGKLPGWIHLPPSCTLPFGAFEEALQAAENRDAAARLAAAAAAVAPATAVARLAECRAAALEVAVPEAAQAALRAAMAAAGVPAPAPGPGWEAALRALRAVWASKYNDRAYVSTRKVGIPFDAVRMAVLCQAVVPARYAFVIHTTNPTTGDEGEVYCELVRGLGEAIVSGTVPGTALAFAARKDALDAPRVLLYPSKSEGMFVDDGSLIFRCAPRGGGLPPPGRGCAAAALGGGGPPLAPAAALRPLRARVDVLTLILCSSLGAGPTPTARTWRATPARGCTTR
jgi:alpha-glucan,water dikinase